METKVRERRKEAYILEADHSLVFLMLLLYQLQVSNLASVIKKLDENGLKYQLIWQVKKKRQPTCPISAQSVASFPKFFQLCLLRLNFMFLYIYCVSVFKGFHVKYRMSSP